MNTIKSLGYAGIGGIALVMLAPSMSFAEADQTAVANAGSRVHRVSHSLAVDSTYTGSTSGYKWGNKLPKTTSFKTQLAAASKRSGYKWGDSASNRTHSDSYAGTPSYQWGTMGFSGQAGYKWGIRSTTDQAGYKWGIRSITDQAGYKWGIRSITDQAGYKWGIRSITDQAGYKWGIR